MDETVKPVRIPPHMYVYADQHHVLHLVQTLLSSLLVNLPDDPISFLLQQLRRSWVDVPKVLILGPPSVGKHTLACRLSAELGAVHVTSQTLMDQSDPEAWPHPQIEEQKLVHLVHQRLKEEDCFNQGWVLEGIPHTRLQALGLQQVGVFPEHVVMLEAPDDVLEERSHGRFVDPLTGDIYHGTFMWPSDAAVAHRLKQSPALPRKQRLVELQRFRREVTGLRSAYQHVLRTFNGDQPHEDVYQQVLAFVRTHRRFRTPRILLMGPPGSGKSHQARLLADKYKMVDVCCEELLRSEAADGSTVGVEIQSYLDDGRTVPAPLLLKLLQERLSRLDCSCRGWVLHGFPGEPQHLNGLQASLHRPNRIYILELTDDMCLERTTLRAIDPVTGERFHAVTRPAPNSEVQSRLKTRAEDDTHTVTHSLSVYRTHAATLQCVFPDAVVINADQDPLSVFEALEAKLTTD